MQPKAKKLTRGKKWYESAQTVLLKDYAERYGGTYIPASFKHWKYTGEHVKIVSASGHETLYISVTSGNSNNSSSNSDTIRLKYVYRPRRKLQFVMVPKKGLLISMMYRDMKPVTMPNSAMSKLFKGVSTHPSLLRTVLKYEGLAEELMIYFHASIKLQIKDGKATLSWSESYKKPDAEIVNERVTVLQYIIKALDEQNVIYDMD